MPPLPRDLSSAARLLCLGLLLTTVAACSSDGFGVPHVKRAAFSEKEFGVSASPRVTNAKNPKKGGGRYLVGEAYVVKGETYTPLENPMGYADSGTASWYGADFHGRLTANGEIFAANAITCASPVLPLPSYVRVTNLDNGRSIICRVNDRGPYLHGRVMDMSYRTAAILGYADKGVGNISVQYVGPAPLEGDDTRQLLASVEGLPAGGGGETTRLALRGDSGGSDLFSGIVSLFGYSEPGQGQATANAAASAADALARGMAIAPDPVTPGAGPVVDVSLGTFADASEAEAIAERFAYLGAVGLEPVAGGSRVTLGRLKPGVGHDDVSALAEELGLQGLVLY